MASRGLVWTFCTSPSRWLCTGLFSNTWTQKDVTTKWSPNFANSLLLPPSVQADCKTLTFHLLPVSQGLSPEYFISENSFDVFLSILRKKTEHLSQFISRSSQFFKTVIFQACQFSHLNFLLLHFIVFLFHLFYNFRSFLFIYLF